MYEIKLSRNAAAKVGSFLPGGAKKNATRQTHRLEPFKTKSVISKIFARRLTSDEVVSTRQIHSEADSLNLSPPSCYLHRAEPDKTLGS